MTELPPHDVDAEQCALGGMLLSADAITDVVAVIDPGDHFRPAHQLVHEAILALHHRGDPVDAVTVADELDRGKYLSKVGGAPYLHTLIAAVPAAVNAGYYAQIVADHAERRRLLEHAERIRQAASDPAGDLNVARELAGPGNGGKPARRAGRRLVLTPASQIEPEPVVWAWEDDGQGRIPAGSLGLFAGREGTGKSSFLIWLTARITTGTLPGSLGTPRGVVYVSVEDSWKFTIVPRLISAGANLDLVYRAEVQVVEGVTVSLSLPADNTLLEEAIVARGVAMVALDPLISAISDTLDTHVNRQVRQALDPLARLADRTGAVIAGIAHFNKSASTDASSLITASGAFKDVARFIFAFAADDQDGSQVITQTKNSLGLSSLPSLAYRIVEAIVPTGRGDARVGRLVLDGPSERTVQDILTVQATGRAERDEKTRAEDYLQKALASGPRRTRDVEEEAHQVHGISKRTLDRARRDLKIPTAKRVDGWWISLPEHEGDLRDQPGDTPASPAKTVKDANDASLGTVGKVAKGANGVSPGDVGSLGTVDDPAADGGYPARHRRAADWPAGSIGEAAQQ